MAESAHQYFDDPAVARLMGMVVALAGEVFVLKAKNERLARALQRQNVLAADAIEDAGGDPELVRWMAAEKDEFAAALLRPLLDLDIAQKLRDEMLSRAPESRS